MGMATDAAETVCLSDKNLTNIPRDVLLKCTYTTTLVVSRNRCIQLHSYIRQSTHLKKLDLSKCDLISIPDELCELTEVGGRAFGIVYVVAKILQLCVYRVYI